MGPLEISGHGWEDTTKMDLIINGVCGRGLDHMA
jgi:hypothetical protein